MKNGLIRKLVLFVLPFALMTAVLCSCETGGDDPDVEPAVMTGDSALRIINDSDFKSTVYFDEVYIGFVNGDGIGYWSVPSGSHTIRVDNAELDNSDPYEGTFDFVEGEIQIITIDWDFNF